MIIRRSCGKLPEIAHSVRGADNAVVTGDVTLEAYVSLWYGAVLRGDAAPIRIGEGSNIQDNCTVHATAGMPVTVGRSVVVGHGAILHSCTVEDGCLIGMGAILLDGCVIGRGSVIGAGALVPPGKIIPPGSMVMGVPGKVVRPVTEEEAAATLAGAEHYVQLGRQELPPAE